MGIESMVGSPISTPEAEFRFYPQMIRAERQFNSCRASPSPSSSVSSPPRGASPLPWQARLPSSQSGRWKVFPSVNARRHRTTSTRNEPSQLLPLDIKRIRLHILVVAEDVTLNVRRAVLPEYLPDLAAEIGAVIVAASGSAWMRAPLGRGR